MADLLCQMQERVEEAKQTHKRELEALNSAYQEKLALMGERETAAREQCGSLQTQLELIEKQIGALKSTLEKEAEKARLEAVAELSEGAKRDLRTATAETTKLAEELAMAKKHFAEKEALMAVEFKRGVDTLYRLLEEKNELLAQSRSFAEQVIVDASSVPVVTDSEPLQTALKKLEETEERVATNLSSERKELETAKENLGKLSEAIELFMGAESSEAKGTSRNSHKICRRNRRARAED